MTADESTWQATCPVIVSLSGWQMPACVWLPVWLTVWNTRLHVGNPPFTSLSFPGRPESGQLQISIPEAGTEALDVSPSGWRMPLLLPYLMCRNSGASHQGSCCCTSMGWRSLARYTSSHTPISDIPAGVCWWKTTWSQLWVVLVCKELNHLYIQSANPASHAQPLEYSHLIKRVVFTLINFGHIT